jgi:hypothetical protein
MLKKLAKAIRRHMLTRKKRKHHERWAELMRAGGTVHTEDEVLVDYIDTRMIGQRHVTPRVMRPFGMWRW